MRIPSGPDDYSALFLDAGAPQDPPFRQGRLTFFDLATGSNSVLVGGGTVNDLPLLNIGDTVNLKGDNDPSRGPGNGDIVVLMKMKSSWAILGRVQSPGSGGLFNAAFDFASAGITGDSGFTITTGFTTRATTTFTTPSWANNALIQAITVVDASNTSAGSDLLRVITDIVNPNGAFGGGESIHAAPNTATLQQICVSAPVYRELTVGAPGAAALGATTTINSRVRTNANTWTGGGTACFLNASVTFRKM